MKNVYKSSSKLLIYFKASHDTCKWFWGSRKRFLSIL